MGAIKDTYDILKDLITMAKDADNQVLVDKACELQERLFDLREDNQRLKAKVAELENQIRQLKDDPASGLTPHDGYYTKQDDHRFFCALCLDNRKKKVTMIKDGKLLFCTECGNRIIMD